MPNLRDISMGETTLPFDLDILLSPKSHQPCAKTVVGKSPMASAKAKTRRNTARHGGNPFPPSLSPPGLRRASLNRAAICVAASCAPLSPAFLYYSAQEAGDGNPSFTQVPEPAAGLLAAAALGAMLIGRRRPPTGR